MNFFLLNFGNVEVKNEKAEQVYLFENPQNIQGLA